MRFIISDDLCNRKKSANQRLEKNDQKNLLIENSVTFYTFLNLKIIFKWHFMWQHKPGPVVGTQIWKAMVWLELRAILRVQIGILFDGDGFSLMGKVIHKHWHVVTYSFSKAFKDVIMKYKTEKEKNSKTRCFLYKKNLDVSWRKARKA